MKGNKKILAVALLLLLVAVSFGTYAIYKTVANSDSATVSAAAWEIKVNNTDVVTSTHTFTLGQINWGTQTHVAEGKIAPGSTGTVDLVLDASNTEVSLDYTVSIGQVTVGGSAVPNGTITVTSGGNSSASGTILLSNSNKVVTVPLTIAWAGAADDGDSKNATDVGLEGEEISITVTVTATQKLS